ncbi:DUF6538 domain-containing protein [Paucimonas lemoignei]|nr:DUF6538 domain-containing protein [Paucimonas lemoignei]
MSKVQKLGTKRVGQASSIKEDKMPTYMRRNPNGSGYEFRRGVPKALQAEIGKTEIKEVLGSKFSDACRKCNQLAAETDRLFEDARAKLRSAATQKQNKRPYHDFYSKLRVIDRVTPELTEQLKAYWESMVDAADVQRRETGFEHLPQEEISSAQQEILPMLRQAWARGDASAFIPSLHQTLHLRGYRLAEQLISSDDEKRLAMALVRSHIKGIQLIEARDAGEDPPVVVTAQPLSSGMSLSGDSIETSNAAADALMLSKVVSHFLATWPKNKKEMLKKHSFLLNAFLEVVGDLPVTSLRQAHVNEFFRLLQRLPPRWQDARRQQKISLRDLAAQDHPTVISPVTFTDAYKASFWVSPDKTDTFDRYVD